MTMISARARKFTVPSPSTRRLAPLRRDLAHRQRVAVAVDRHRVLAALLGIIGGRHGTAARAPASRARREQACPRPRDVPSSRHEPGAGYKQSGNDHACRADQGRRPVEFRAADVDRVVDGPRTQTANSGTPASLTRTPGFQQGLGDQARLFDPSDGCLQGGPMSLSTDHDELVVHLRPSRDRASTIRRRLFGCRSSPGRVRRWSAERTPRRRSLLPCGTTCPSSAAG